MAFQKSAMFWRELFRSLLFWPFLDWNLAEGFFCLVFIAISKKGRRSRLEEQSCLFLIHNIYSNLLEEKKSTWAPTTTSKIYPCFTSHFINWYPFCVVWYSSFISCKVQNSRSLMTIPLLNLLGKWRVGDGVLPKAFLTAETRRFNFQCGLFLSKSVHWYGSRALSR